MTSQRETRKFALQHDLPARKKIIEQVMLYLNYLFLIFEWSACKLAGQAKCSFHYKQAFNLLTFFNKRHFTS